VSALVARVTAAAATLCGFALLCCLLLQVVARYAFDAPLAWTDETSIFLFVWTVMLVASLGVRERFHVRIEFLVRVLPAPLQSVLDACCHAAIALFGGVLVVSGRDMVDLVWGNTSPAIQYPAQALYLAIPVSGALIIVHSVARLLGGGPRSAP
jgi:TRAP-type C4-dicarboxylate transport system permease small subunit